MLSLLWNILNVITLFIVGVIMLIAIYVLLFDERFRN